MWSVNTERWPCHVYRAGRTWTPSGAFPAWDVLEKRFCGLVQAPIRTPWVPRESLGLQGSSKSWGARTWGVWTTAETGICLLFLFGAWLKVKSLDFPEALWFLRPGPCLFEWHPEILSELLGWLPPMSHEEGLVGWPCGAPLPTTFSPPAALTSYARRLTLASEHHSTSRCFSTGVSSRWKHLAPGRGCDMARVPQVQRTGGKMHLEKLRGIFRHSSTCLCPERKLRMMNNHQEACQVLLI